MRCIVLKLYTKFSIVIALILFSVSAYSQVKIGSNSYSNLYSAFNAINSGTHTGNIVIQITDNFTESNTAFLYASGYGNASYNSVTIYPTGEYTIKSSQSNGIICFAGASNVTFDGRVNQSGTSIGLSIEQTANSGPLIRVDSLINGSNGVGPKDNVIKYINFKGYNKTGTYGITFGSHNSWSNYGGGENNEIAYCTFKKMYQGLRIYGMSGTGATQPRSVKVHHNVFGSANLAETITYQAIYAYYTYNPQIYDNLFQYLDYTSTVYALYSYYCDYPEVYNNTVQNINNASSVQLFYVYYANYPKVYGNTMDNIKATGSLQCIYIYQPTSTVAYVYNNSMSNLSATSTMYGIYLSGGGSNYSQVYNNSVKNVENTSYNYVYYIMSSYYLDFYNNVLDNVNSAAVSSTNYGVYLSSCSYSNIYDNKVNNCTVAGYMNAFYMTSCTQSKVYRNYVNHIHATGTGGTSANGFYISSCNNTEFVNNTVSDMVTTQYSTGYTSNPMGFLITGGTGYKFYYNSVYLTGKQYEVGTSTSMSACMYFSTTSINTLDIRNNTFVNTLEGRPGGYSLAIYIPGSGNMTNSTINYNNYYVSGLNSTFIGYYQGYRTDFANWKTSLGSGRDANSMNEDPLYNATYNLAPFVGSPIVGKGTPISAYTTDMLGANRSSTNPTIGAYENSGDIVGPEIKFTRLLTTTDQNNRKIVANITDRTGVNTTTSEPRIYFRKQATDNTYIDNSSTTAGWKYNSGVQNGNEFTFTIDYSKINGGAGPGDVIEYFIIAQDVATLQNISITSGVFNSFPTSTHLTASNFPVNKADNYRLALGVSGTYEVGTGKTITSLSKPDGMFDVLNKNVVNGDVIIEITSDLEETGEIILGKLTYEGSPNYTITIRPNTNKQRKIMGESATYLIGIVGANNVTIDGSYKGEGRYLLFNNTATNSISSYRATLMVGSGGGPVYGGQNMTIQNCEIKSGSRLNYSFGIISADAAISTSTSTMGMRGLTIRNNWIYNVTYGMYIAGGSGTGQTMDNLLIEKNIIGSETTSESILSYGIEVRYAPYGNIRYNKIFNFDGGPNNTNNIYGIQIYGFSTQPTIIDGNTITGLNYQGTSICTVIGINLQSGYYHELKNNLISEILSTQYISYSPSYVYNYSAMGLRINSYYTKLWHNTIYMTGTMKYYTSSQGYGGFASNVAFTNTSYNGMDFRGNIFHNSVAKASNNIQDVEANIFGFYVPVGHPVGNLFNSLDRNLYSVGNTARIASIYNTSWSSPYPAITADWTAKDLNQWKSYAGKDVNSYQVQPPVVNTEKGKTDVHLAGDALGVSSYMYDGMYEITTDVDGEMRNKPTYYGADELNPMFEFAEDTKIAPAIPTQCLGDAVTVSVNPVITGFADGVERKVTQGVNIQWYKNGQKLSGQTKKNITFNPVKMADSARYYATASFMDKSLTSTEVLLKVEDGIKFSLQPKTTDVCVTNPTLYLPTNPTGTIFTYQWEFKKAGTSSWNDLYGKIQKDLSIPLVTNNEVGEYRLKVTGPGNCGSAVVYSDVAQVTLSEPLANISIEQYGKSAGKVLTHTCFGDNVSLKTNVDGTIFAFRWQRDAGQGFVDLSGAQYPSAYTPILEINNADPNESGVYRCKILGSASCGTAERFTDPIKVTIWPYFVLDQQPESRILCEGENSFIRVNVTGVVYSYHWYKDGVALTAKESEYWNKPVLYINNASFDQSGTYTCQVEAEDCFGHLSFMSEPASVYVITGTDITKAPFTQSVILGNDINFRVRAHVNGAPKDFKPTVQWYKGNEPLKDGGRFIGTKSDMLMIKNVQSSDLGEDYRVVVTGHCGSAESKDFGIIKGEIQITEQPQSVKACQYEDITLSVKAEVNIPNTQLEYNWYKEGILVTEGNGYTGTNTPNLHINSVNESHAGNYYALVKPVGTLVGITTVDAIIEVTNKAEIIEQPEDNITLRPGEALTLQVEAIGTEIEYQWYFNDVAINDANENTLIIYNTREENSGKYYVIVSNSCGEVKSNVSNVTVTTTTTDVKAVVASKYELGVPMPNPANNLTNISYTIPQTSRVKIALINELGSEVAVLQEGTINEGSYTLMMNIEQLNLTSGVYNIVLNSSGVMLTQKIIIIK